MMVEYDRRQQLTAKPCKLFVETQHQHANMGQSSQTQQGGY